MKHIRAMVVGVALLWGTAAETVFGQPQGVPGTPVPSPLGPLNDDEFRLSLDAEEAANVDRLVPLLSSPDYKQRETATNSLIEIGAPAFARLRSAYEQTDDLEMRLRVEQVVRTAYLNRYVFDRNGFLGVQLDALEQIQAKGRPQTKVDNGVVIRRVIPDSAASRAGLRQDDIIVALNGVPLTGRGTDEVTRFRESIPTFSPGTKIRLGIVRGNERQDTDVTIGRCPEDTARAGTVRFSPLYHQVNERFEIWWFKYFRVTAKSDDEP